jgi:NADH-ubiquinone oxidoreductase chain 5
VFSFGGAILAIVLNHFYAKALYDVTLTPVGLKTYAFLNKKWYFDKIYNEYINKPLVSFGYFVSFRGIDKGVVEMLGPYGIVSSFKHLMIRTSKIQSGFIYHYAFVMLIGILIILTSVTFWDSLQSFIFTDSRLLFILLAVITFYSNMAVSKA